MYPATAFCNGCLLKQCSACRHSSHVQQSLARRLACYRHPELRCRPAERAFKAPSLQYKAAFCIGALLASCCNSFSASLTVLCKFPWPLSFICCGHKESNGLAGHACKSPAGKQDAKQFQQSGPDISSLPKELQQQWHPDKNAHLENVIVTPGSGRKVWWSCDQCPDGMPHVWESTADRRTRGSGCPYCSGHEVCQHNTLARKAPELTQYWDTARNGSTSPNHITFNTHLRAHWKCPICLYKWQAKIYGKVRASSACPKCAKANGGRKQDGTRSKHPTFASDNHPLLRQWHPELKDEEGNFPDNITLQSGKHIWWICDQCPNGKPHIWQARPSDRTRGKRPTGCPYCAGQDVCECNSLQTVCPYIAADFDVQRNRVTPAQVTFSSVVRYSWLSDKPGATKRSPNRRTLYSRVKARAGSESM